MLDRDMMVIVDESKSLQKTMIRKVGYPRLNQTRIEGKTGGGQMTLKTAHVSYIPFLCSQSRKSRRDRAFGSLTVVRYDDAVERFIAFVGDMPVKELSTEHVVGYKSRWSAALQAISTFSWPASCCLSVCSETILASEILQTLRSKHCACELKEIPQLALTNI